MSGLISGRTFLCQREWEWAKFRDKINRLIDFFMFFCYIIPVGKNIKIGKRMKDSKNKLLRTAFELFALRGLDGVSTREIVRKAGVNIHAISYYFGGKEGLYEAVVDYVIDFMNEEGKTVFHFKEYSEGIENLTEEEAEDRLLKVLGEFIDFDFLPKNKYVALFLLREKFYPSKYNKKFDENIVSPSDEIIAKCVSKITGLAVGDAETAILSHMIFAPTIGLWHEKNKFIKKAAKKEGERYIIESAKKLVEINTKAILNEYKKERK